MLACSWYSCPSISRFSLAREIKGTLTFKGFTVYVIQHYIIDLHPVLTRSFRYSVLRSSTADCLSHQTIVWWPSSSRLPLLSCLMTSVPLTTLKLKTIYSHEFYYAWFYSGFISVLTMSAPLTALILLRKILKTFYSWSFIVHDFSLVLCSTLICWPMSVLVSSQLYSM